MSTTPASPAYSGTPDEQTFGQLVAAASRDLSALVRDEIELAKSEIKVDVKNGAVGGAMFGAAGFLAVLVVILLSIAAAYGLVAAGLHPGWAFTVVAVVYLLIAAAPRVHRHPQGEEARPAGAHHPHQQGHRRVPQEPPRGRLHVHPVTRAGPFPDHSRRCVRMCRVSRGVSARNVANAGPVRVGTGHADTSAG